MYHDSRNSRRYRVRGRFLGASRSVLRGDLRDLSPTGLCLSTSAEVERGHLLHLEFELPTGEVDLVAEVRWASRVESGGYELGLRIVRISAVALEAIRALTTDRRHFVPPPTP
jgi:hypothetical protein